MPALNKQTLVNLLIDSPLREPIKINLIDIVNNTADTDLAKVYPTIVKELEIFQKATERRMKLAEETIAKLGEDAPASPAVASSEGAAPTADTAITTPSAPTDTPALSVPPLDLPPLPQPPKMDEATVPATITSSEPTPVVETPAPASSNADSPTGTPADADETALAEIQKELDALKTGAAEDANPPTASTSMDSGAPAPQA